MALTFWKKLNKVLEKRHEPFNKEDGLVDWAQAEQLAFATILQDGTPIRLTGQDSERGTFSHRHAVLHDEQTGETYTPLHHVPDQKRHLIYTILRFRSSSSWFWNTAIMWKTKKLQYLGSAIW